MTTEEIAGTFTDQPTQVATIIVKKWWFFKRSKPLFIYPLPIGKVQLIGAELCSMLGPKELAGKDHTEQINSILESNTSKVVKIIALASLKGSQMPSQERIESIANNLTVQELHKAFYEVYRRLDLSTFFDIMALSKNLSLSLIPEAEVLGQ